MRRDFIRFWAHALRGQTGPWAPPAGAGRGGNAIRDALLGGDLDKVTGKRVTFSFFPWNWDRGDGCIIRLVAMIDKRGAYRIESGESF
jgi:hypothetical protein